MMEEVKVRVVMGVMMVRRERAIAERRRNMVVFWGTLRMGFLELDNGSRLEVDYVSRE